MTVIYIIIVYCIIALLLAAFIANKRNSSFFKTFLYILGGPLTFIMYLLRLKNRDVERSYYKRGFFTVK